MAFDIDYMGRVSSGANNQTKKVWVYNGTATGSNETVATIAASGYFNAFMTNITLGLGPLGVNDLIIINGNDASAFYLVTAIVTNVTVSVFAASGVVGTGNISDGAVTTPKIADANVTLAKLAAGIAPSHVIKFGGQLTSVGGAAAEAFTVTGAVAATDIAFVQVVNDGPNNVTVLQAVVTNNTLTVTFSADPGAGAVINYQLIRASA